MSSAYGAIAAPAAGGAAALAAVLPVRGALRDGSPVTVDLVRPGGEDDAVIAKMCGWLNSEIRAGNTYPQDRELDESGFRNYFLSHSAFIARDDTSGEPIGMFYVKVRAGQKFGLMHSPPNYPGRCSHICNGGFVTSPEYRGKGVGKAMGKAFLVVAPALGYKASMFNLVFE
ncbi:hypothetical protein HK405_010307 [Cladochytrium tenue]|nr:hypothetical protein HK405_010307 [Cladochytrium tenue]